MPNEDNAYSNLSWPQVIQPTTKPRGYIRQDEGWKLFRFAHRGTPAGKAFRKYCFTAAAGALVLYSMLIVLPR